MGCEKRKICRLMELTTQSKESQGKDPPAGQLLRGDYGWGTIDIRSGFKSGFSSGQRYSENWLTEAKAALGHHTEQLFPVGIVM